jgi:hypothetical protein
VRPLISPYQSTRVIPAVDRGGRRSISQPGSTDTQSSSSDGGSLQRKNRNSSHCRRTSRTKSRSRSSTVVSLVGITISVSFWDEILCLSNHIVIVIVSHGTQNTL